MLFRGVVCLGVLQDREREDDWLARGLRVRLGGALDVHEANISGW
jgi:hypothetical protein